MNDFKFYNVQMCFLQIITRIYGPSLAVTHHHTFIGLEWNYTVRKSFWGWLYGAAHTKHNLEL